MISDATAETLLGMSARSFREAIVRQQIPHVKLGARVVVAVEDLVRLARASSANDPERRDDGDEVRVEREPETSDDMLAALGFAPTGGSDR